MTTLKDQVKEFVKFDEDIVYAKTMISYEYIEGAEAWNEHLSPLLAILPEVVEALECMQDLDCDANDVFRCKEIAKQTLAKIKEAVGGTK